MTARPLVVLSPHLDDGAFCCGTLLASSPAASCVTVFAGVPPDPDVATPWDTACGFGSAREAIAHRRGEDAAALAELGATPHWLDFCDDQYGVATPLADIVTALQGLLASGPRATVAFPLGLFHRDHERTHAAGLALAAVLPAHAWLLYEDAIYRRQPGLLTARLRALESRALAPFTPATASAAPARKARAVAHYASQLRGLCTPGRPGCDDVFASERYWTLGPGPAP